MLKVLQNFEESSKMAKNLGEMKKTFVQFVFNKTIFPGHYGSIAPIAIFNLGNLFNNEKFLLQSSHIIKLPL